MDCSLSQKADFYVIFKTFLQKSWMRLCTAIKDSSLKLQIVND